MKPNKEQLRSAICSRVMYRSASLVSKQKETEQRADAQANTNADATFILISTDNACERYDWWDDTIFIEELDIKGADYSGLKTFFKDHNPSVDTASGVVENLRVEKNQLIGDVRFGKDEQSQILKQKYDDGILTDVSIGYRIDDYEYTEKKDDNDLLLVTKFRIIELSAVWKGADAGAIKIKSNEPVEVNEKRYSYEIYEKKLNSNNRRK
ncbi:HK97 family phage prohead protease [Arcobacter arenosus]|uniref:Peptidase n=1 Tax=Arcobacter arenosus TaxID=2576037 RepID=A0A5R8Y4P1_9BACT|nr:HK97 family phage prohead protease [Arcobacter arenosus]TLP41045.1 peptidase [Arcobacter arenosus]